MVSATLSPPLKRSPPQDMEAVVKSIIIPPCPATLVQLQQEMAASNPDARAISRLVTEDVALSLTVLRTVNAPFYGLRREVQSIAQAVAFIGLKPLAALVTSSLMREAVAAPGLALDQFWQVANHRSCAMRLLAQRLGGVDADTAQSFGLFCDMGIPLLMRRFPAYSATLVEASAALDRAFTEVECARHGADHAQVGAIMARTWGLNDLLCLAIRRDHDVSVFHDPAVPEGVCRLIAMSLVADLAISRFTPVNANQEWAKGGHEAVNFLMLSDYDLADWMETLKEGFFALER